MAQAENALIQCMVQKNKQTRNYEHMPVREIGVFGQLSRADGKMGNGPRPTG